MRHAPSTWLLVTAAFAVSLPAACASPTTPREQRIAAAAEKPSIQKTDERKICKTVNTTGSRLGAKRVCMTREQWKKVES